MADSSPSRWQFSLRTAFALTLAGALCFWWFSGGETTVYELSSMGPVFIHHRLSGTVDVIVDKHENSIWSSPCFVIRLYSATQAWLLDIGIVAFALLISGFVIIIPSLWRKRFRNG